MKGLMVTLLVLVMTGTVIGQQSNQPENADKPGRFFLWLNDDLIEELKTNPSGLLADVPASARGKITEVSLRYEKVHTDSHDNEPQTPGRFNLWLDDSLIQQLKTNPLGLVANLPESLQGKLEQVVLKYEANASNTPDHFHPEAPESDSLSAGIANKAANPATGNNRFSTSDFSPPSNSASRWSTPQYSSNDSLRQNQPVADSNFPTASVDSLSENLRRLRQQSTEQPTSTDEARRWTTLNQQQQFGNRAPTNNSNYSASGFQDQANSVLTQTPPSIPQNNNDEFRPRFGSSTRTAPQYDDGVQRLTAVNARPTMQPTTPIVDNSDVEFQSELIRRETEKLRQQRVAAERAAAEKSLADQRAQYQEELRLQNLRNQGLTNEGLLPITAPSNDFVPDRYAMRTDQQLIQNPTYQFPTRRAESSTPSQSYDYTTAPSRQKLTSAPLVAQNGSLNGLRAEISGPNSNGIVTGGANSTRTPNTALGDIEDHNDRAYKFMFFMLMFSIGVNVYLAWISRGFYVRYSELADELRETFTTSI